jgi:hypothetical protein
MRRRVEAAVRTTGNRTCFRVAKAFSRRVGEGVPGVAEIKTGQLAWRCPVGIPVGIIEVASPGVYPDQTTCIRMERSERSYRLPGADFRKDQSTAERRRAFDRFDSNQHCVERDRWALRSTCAEAVQSDMLNLSYNGGNRWDRLVVEWTVLSFERPVEER